jgi:hypothetical protein
VVSPAEHRPEGGVEGALDPPQPWRGRLDVLEEAQLPAGPDNPVELAQGPLGEFLVESPDRWQRV